MEINELNDKVIDIAGDGGVVDVVDITNQLTMDSIILAIKSFFINAYEYLYPFVIKYMLLFKEYNLIAIGSVFILFNILYFSYLELAKKEFEMYHYIIMLFLMPITVIIYFFLLLDIVLKRVLHFIFRLKFPYIKYEIQLQIDAIDRELKLREQYNKKFENDFKI